MQTFSSGKNTKHWFFTKNVDPFIPLKLIQFIIHLPQRAYNHASRPWALLSHIWQNLCPLTFSWRVYWRNDRGRHLYGGRSGMSHLLSKMDDLSAHISDKKMPVVKQKSRFFFIFGDFFAWHRSLATLVRWYRGIGCWCVRACNV